MKLKETKLVTPEVLENFIGYWYDADAIHSIEMAITEITNLGTDEMSRDNINVDSVKQSLRLAANCFNTLADVLVANHE